MARRPIRQIARESQGLPVSSTKAEMAFQAHAALSKLAARQPDLLQNEYFVALLDTAAARFRKLFEAL